MSKYVRIAVAAILLVAGFHPSLSGARDLAFLEGIGTVTVFIEDLPEKLTRMGLYKSAIRAEVVPRLRRSGIEVINMQDGFETPYLPTLYVNVNGFQNRYTHGLVSFSYRLELIQDVRILGREDVETSATTWLRGGLALAGHDDFIGCVRQYVGELVDRFTSDFRQVNPGLKPVAEPVEPSPGREVASGGEPDMTVDDTVATAPPPADTTTLDTLKADSLAVEEEAEEELILPEMKVPEIRTTDNGK